MKYRKSEGKFDCKSEGWNDRIIDSFNVGKLDRIINIIWEGMKEETTYGKYKGMINRFWDGAFVGNVIGVIDGKKEGKSENT